MAIFDYKCPNCELKHNDVYVYKYDDKVKCKRCRTVLKKLFSMTNVSGHVFPADGIFLEHVSPDGKLFHSKGEMREFERRSGTTIGLLH